jgi:SAM-dependent methyltransferase
MMRVGPRRPPGAVSRIVAAVVDAAPEFRHPHPELLPPRYSQPWLLPFERNIELRLRPGMSVLDIGGGRRPAVPPERRPAAVTYVGLDPDGQEFEAAVPGSYDREFVARAEDRIPELESSIDLIVSWQVFEHVTSMSSVLSNSYDYLKPGGSLISFFSGRWSVFGVVNRLVPHRLGAPIVTRIAKRRAGNKPVFPAYYDACSATGIRRLTRRWSHVEVVPFYRAAVYFSFAKPALRAYLAYENAIRRLRWENGATHYLLVATR